jgi:CIC family chloride channel protein
MPNSDQPTRRGGSIRLKFGRLLKRMGFGEDAWLIVLGGIIGILTGLGSVGFTKLIHLSHDLCYGDSQSGGIYSGRSFYLILLPAAGALLVGLITYFFAREAKGHGVPEVMDAIARRDGMIRPRVALAKAVASALTIGSGGSAGTEGPIIQIGAAIGSSAGRYFQVIKHNVPVLVGCGAAAGISAIFHAPIAGVLFALEIFLRELNFKTFSPVMIASVLSSVTTQAILGKDEAIFPLIEAGVLRFEWYELGNYILLGLVCACAAVIFIKLLYATEDLFDKITKIHYILKPVIGAILLGLLGIGLVALLEGGQRGEPLIFGNGYPLIGLCIGASPSDGTSALHLTIWVLLLLFAAKTLATCLTLGSGGSGGVFAPSLFLGAVLGYAFGLLAQQTGWFNGLSPASYSLVGMASVVAATTHAPMAAILILFELTRDYRVILPAMLSATIAMAIAQLMCRDSIYTLKLRRRGVQYESRANTAILRRLTVKMVMDPDYAVLYDDVPMQEVVKKAAELETSDFIIIDHDDHYLGLLTATDIRTALLQPEALPLLVTGELARQKVPTVGPRETLDIVLDKFSLLEVNRLAVHSEFNDHKFIGTISRSALMRRYQQELQGK